MVKPQSLDCRWLRSCWALAQFSSVWLCTFIFLKGSQHAIFGHTLNTLFQCCSIKDCVSKNVYILRYQILGFSIRTLERYILDNIDVTL